MKPPIEETVLNRRFLKPNTNELQRFAQENLIKQQKNSTENSNLDELQQSDLDENTKENLTDSESESTINESSRSSVSEAYSPGSNRRNSDSGYKLNLNKAFQDIRRNSTASTYSLEMNSATSQKIEEEKENSISKEARGFGNHSAMSSRNSSPELNRELLNNTESSISQPRRSSLFKLELVSEKLNALHKQNDSLSNRRNSVEYIKKNERSPITSEDDKRSHSVQYEIYKHDNELTFNVVSSVVDNFKKRTEQKKLNEQAEALKTKSSSKLSTSDSEEFSGDEDNILHTEKLNTNSRQKIVSLKLSEEETIDEADLNSCNSDESSPKNSPGVKQIVSIADMTDEEWSDNELEYPVAENAPTPGSLPLDHSTNSYVDDEYIVDKLAGVSLQNSDENK